jgi:hypothetical protein
MVAATVSPRVRANLCNSARDDANATSSTSCSCTATNTARKGAAFSSNVVDMD